MKHIINILVIILFLSSCFQAERKNNNNTIKAEVEINGINWSTNIANFEQSNDHKIEINIGHSDVFILLSYVIIKKKLTIYLQKIIMHWSVTELKFLKLPKV